MHGRLQARAGQLHAMVELQNLELILVHDLDLVAGLRRMISFVELLLEGRNSLLLALYELAEARVDCLVLLSC